MIFIYTSFILVLTGCIGLIINRRNLLVMLLCIELIFMAANINFMTFASIQGDLDGYIMVLFTLAITAAESAVALALFVLMYRLFDSVDANRLTNIRG